MFLCPSLSKQPHKYALCKFWSSQMCNYVINWHSCLNWIPQIELFKYQGGVGKPGCVCFTRTLFPRLLWPPEELSLQMFANRQCRCSFCPAPPKQTFPTQQHSAPHPPPTSLISSSSSVGGLSKSIIAFQFIRVFNWFCTLSQNSAPLWYRAGFQQAESQGRAASALHCSLFGSKLLDHYNPVSPKYNVPSSYLNEHSFARAMCFNTFSPRTAALGSCHKWKADTTYQNTKSSFKNK